MSAPSVLVDQGWAWMTINGSQVAHLCPPVPMPRSRTACGRLPIWDATIELTGALLADVRRCLACEAYGRARS